jgi:hypothetical protein
MPGKRGLPQCVAVTTKDVRCRAKAIQDGLCECHSPVHGPKWRERQRAKTKAYWAARRIAEQFVAATGGA